MGNGVPPSPWPVANAPAHPSSPGVAAHQAGFHGWLALQCGQAPAAASPLPHPCRTRISLCLPMWWRSGWPSAGDRGLEGDGTTGLGHGRTSELGGGLGVAARMGEELGALREVLLAWAAEEPPPALERRSCRAARQRSDWSTTSMPAARRKMRSLTRIHLGFFCGYSHHSPGLFFSCVYNQNNQKEGASIHCI